MRGGTIHRVDGGFSYGEIRVAGPLLPASLRQPLRTRDVARFVVYYRAGRHSLDRANERPSKADRRSVRFYRLCWLAEGRADGRCEKPFRAEPWAKAIEQWMQATGESGVNLQVLYEC